MKRIKIAVLIMLLLANRPAAQVVEKGLELGEVIRIAEVYKAMPYLSFTMSFTYSDSAGQAPQEEMACPYKLHEGLFWTIMDSSEYLQGGMYSLGIYHADKIITVAKPAPFSNVFRLAVLDSVFQAAYVKTVTVTAVNDSVRSLKLAFAPGAAYSGYELRYNKNNYLLQQLTYYIKNDRTYDNGSSTTSRIGISFSGYSTAPFSTDYFREDKYIYPAGTGFKPKPAYADYKIILNGEF